MVNNRSTQLYCNHRNISDIYLLLHITMFNAQFNEVKRKQYFCNNEERLKMLQERKNNIASAENETLFRCPPNKVLRFYYLVLENYYKVSAERNANRCLLDNCNGNFFYNTYTSWQHISTTFTSIHIKIE